MSLFFIMQIQYNVKLRVNSFREITLTNCDCAAGAGVNAMCKHCAASLYQLVNIKSSGQLGEVNEACTDVLQSFHKPSKTYDGKPSWTSCECIYTTTFFHSKFLITQRGLVSLLVNHMGYLVPTEQYFKFVPLTI